MFWREWLPSKQPSLARALIVGLSATVAALLVRILLSTFFGAEFPLLAFFPALLAAGVFGGPRGSLVSLSLSCLLADLFLLPPMSPQRLGFALAGFVVAGGLLSLVGSALASTIIELRETQQKTKAAETDLRTLVGELAHRNRNGLTVVMSIVSQSARKTASSKELADIVNARLGAMADAQDEVIRGGSDTADLRSLLERTLSPFDLDRVTFGPSPPVRVAAPTASALALLAHELATNAVKHGSLSSAGGRVVVSWRAQKPLSEICWRECGGPPVSEPTTKGFGTRLLGRVLETQGGRVSYRFEPDGLVCDIEFPAQTDEHPRMERRPGLGPQLMVESTQPT